VNLAKKTIQKVFLLLQKKSRHSLDRVRVVGGIEKKTSTAIKAEIDSVIYYNDVNNNLKKEDIVDDFKKVLLLNTNLTQKDIYITKNNSMKFTMDGVPIDLLVGVNMVSSNATNVASQQSREILQLIKQSADPQTASEMNSTELSESSLEFIKSKSKFVHDVARLAKFWNQNILFKTYVFGRSYIIELLAVDAALEEENNKGSSISNAFKGFLNRVCHLKSQEIIFEDYYKVSDNKGFSISNAFKGFLNRVCHIKSQEIIFEDYYKISDIPISIRNQKPLLMDPSNPYNNLLHVANTKDGQHFMEMFQVCARVTYNMMKNGCNDINLLFYPQPMLYQLRKKEKWIQLKDGTYHISLTSKDHLEVKKVIPNMPLMPDLILRDPQGNDLKDDLQAMLFTLAGFTYSIIMQHPGMTSRKIMEEVAAFVKKMEGKDGVWVPGSWKHDKKAVTLVVPFNDPKKRVLLLSFDFCVANI